MTILRTFIEAMASATSKVFADFGEVTPRFVMEVTQDGEKIIALMPVGHLDKDIWANAAKSVMESNGTERYCFIAEAWYALMKVDEELSGAVRDRPDRRECVQYVAEDRTEGTMGAMQMITRDKDGKGTLGELDFSGGLISGRFCGLLPTGEKAQ